jgi:threonine dehydrogenase-like Zn-dependent dehydrogenase
MKGWIIKDKNLEFAKILKPRASKGAILVKNKVSSICGSDLGIISGAVDVYEKGVVLGHELSGIVEKISSGIKNFKLGDKIAVNPYISCKKCFYCERGKFNLCGKIEIIGAHRHGGFGEYSVVPKENLIALGDIPLELGCFVQPVACGLAAVKKLKNSLEKDLEGQLKKIFAENKTRLKILVLGGGPMGLIIGYMCREILNAKIFLAEKNSHRRVKYGPLITYELLNPAQEKVFLNQILIKTGGGADIIIDTIGNLLKASYKYVRENGRILLFGLDKKSELNQYELTKREINEIWRPEVKKVRLIGSYLALPEDFNEAIEWMRNLKNQQFLNSLISHKLPSRSLRKGVSLLQNGMAMKVLITH